ncbi:MAG TPA: glycosyltransferase [Burkholderiales bacterium]
MRFAYVGASYVSYLRSFYAARPLLALEPFVVQEDALRLDRFGWNGAWTTPMAELGYEAREFHAGNPYLDQAWRREHGGADAPAVLAQLDAFDPEVILYDHGDAELLRALKAAARPPLVIGWEGGGLSRQACWPDFDLILSCAPESVATLCAAGANAAHMHHAFNPAVLEQLGAPARENRIAFFGQLVREGDFHLRREQNLVRICASGLPFDLYSPSYSYGTRDMLLARVMMALCLGYRALSRAPGLRGRVARLPWGVLADPARPFPQLPVHPRLRPNLRPAQYGLAMYESIGRASVCLNIHADNTPDYASNMRLFETTGMGTCLLTDKRRNIADLFAPDREAVIYDGLDDCIEKMRWLIDHPAQAREIGAAGQARTLRENTFRQRAEQLHSHILRLATQKSAALQRL